jgi:hypothetical protein
VGIVPHIVPRDGFYCEESWSEWQDLNLRPLVPERDKFAILCYPRRYPRRIFKLRNSF